MVIGIDARSISGKTCGVSRVVACLLKALSGIDSHNTYIVYTDKIDNLDLGSNFKVRKTGLSRMNILNDRKFSALVGEDGIEVFFSGHSWLPLFLGSKVHKIVLIYDIFTVTDPDFFRNRNPKNFLRKKP